MCVCVCGSFAQLRPEDVSGTFHFCVYHAQSESASGVIADLNPTSNPSPTTPSLELLGTAQVDLADLLTHSTARVSISSDATFTSPVCLQPSLVLGVHTTLH